MNNYPYTNTHELNLDWILKQVQGIDDKYKDLDATIAAGVEAVQHQEEVSLQALNTQKLTIVAAINGARDIAIGDVNTSKNDALAAIAALGNTWDAHYESLIAEMPADLASITQTLAILGRILTGNSLQTVTFFMGDYNGGSKTNPAPSSTSDVSTDMIIGGAGFKFVFTLDNSVDANTNIYAIRWFEGKNASTGVYTDEHVVSCGNVRTYTWTVPDTCYCFSITLRNNVTWFTAAPASNIATLRWFTTISDFVSVDGDQNFTDGQKAQGRENIGAASEDDVAALNKAMQDNEIIDVFEDGTYTNSNWRGITLTWNNKVATLSGTATGGNFTSPNIFINANAFPQNIKAGDILNININKTTQDVALDIFVYINNELSNEAQISRTQKYTIPSNATGMIMRLLVYNGKTVSGNFSFSITKSATVKSMETVLPTILPAKDSIEDSIEAILNKHGVAVLGKGTYELKRAIQMPDNSMITGAGESTIIKAANNADGIIVGANCCIQNVRIHSETGHTDTKGLYAGIRIVGNHESEPLKYNIKIDNVTVDGFTLAGIYGKATGTWAGNSITVSNCKLYNCYAGLLLEDYSEFGRYTNILSYNNYCGLMNKSGNNVFVNCTFSNNTVGVYLYGDDGDNSLNNGHGSIIGCTINHSNNNNGFAVICRGISGNGFVFSGCQIWYGKIQVEQSTGIIFDNCMLGAYNTNTEIINYTANDLFLMNCLFKVGATFVVSGGETHTINCFRFDGTPITA